MAKPKNREAHDKARTQEAKRILEGVHRDSETVGTSSMRRTAERTRDHFMGRDAAEGDNIELWGKRIGRGLALIVALILIYHLATTYIL